MQRLAEIGRGAIVVEGDYPDLVRTQPSRGSWLAEMLGRLAVRYPEVPMIFAGSQIRRGVGPTASSWQPWATVAPWLGTRIKASRNSTDDSAPCY